MLTPVPPYVVSWMETLAALPLRNAAVESALSHARALAYFLKGPSSSGDVTRSDFAEELSELDHELIDLAGRTIGAVSNHQAHSLMPAPSATPLHPGPWPIIELAVALVSPIVEFAVTVDHTGKLFGPGPAFALGGLVETIGGKLPPASSFDMPGYQQSPDVAVLTSAARQYVAARPHLLDG